MKTIIEVQNIITVKISMQNGAGERGVTLLDN